MACSASAREAAVSTSYPSFTRKISRNCRRLCSSSATRRESFPSGSPLVGGARVGGRHAPPPPRPALGAFHPDSVRAAVAAPGVSGTGDVPGPLPAADDHRLAAFVARNARLLVGGQFHASLGSLPAVRPVGATGGRPGGAELPDPPLHPGGEGDVHHVRKGPLEEFRDDPSELRGEERPLLHPDVAAVPYRLHDRGVRGRPPDTLLLQPLAAGALGET